MGTREAGHNQSRSIVQDSLSMGSVLAQDELECSCQRVSLKSRIGGGFGCLDGSFYWRYEGTAGGMVL